MRHDVAHALSTVDGRALRRGHLIVLCKTLTAEALAAYFGGPLCHISFAELCCGSTVAELETLLTEVLSLEASCSMTGVLLRLLEPF